MFEEAAVAVKEELVRQSKGGLTFLAEKSGGALSSSMDHLACFAGGMFALAGGSWLELAEEMAVPHLLPGVSFQSEAACFRLSMAIMAHSYMNDQVYSV